MGEFLGRIPLALLAAGCLSLCGGRLAAQADGAKSDSSEPAAGEPGSKGTDVWVLDFTFQKVAVFQPTEGVRRGEVYWYMLYRIENKTGQDRAAYITVSARSDKDKSYASTYLPDVEALVERKVGKPLWGRADEAQALKERADKGELTSDKATFNYFAFKAGEVRDCVAIFNKLDPGASKVSITVEGLSNDVHLIEREGSGRKIQSRVFALELERPGDEYAMSLDRFRLKAKGWTKKLTDLVVPNDG